MSRLNSQYWKGVLLIGVLLPVMVQAELTVIYDNGQTKPIAPFLEVFGTTKERTSAKPDTLETTTRRSRSPSLATHPIPRSDTRSGTAQKTQQALHPSLLHDWIG